MSLTVTGLDEVGPSRRGLRRCPGCRKRALQLYDTRRTNGIATRGSVARRRRFECLYCGALVRFIEISVGIVQKRSESPWRDRDEDELTAEVEILPDKIIILA